MRGLLSVGALACFLFGCTGDAIPIGDSSGGIKARHCSNGALDSDETDVDCGGADCKACADDKKCGKNGDCSSGNCDSGTCKKGCGVCNPANGVGHCVNGACGLASCNAGFADCNASAADGCEVNVASDSSNCGACGQVCDRVACVAGACQKPACDPTTCNLAHATAQCLRDQCTIAACDAGYADCDNDPGNGCEVSAASDPNNCGGCGQICQGGACVNGACDGGCDPTTCNPPNAVGQCVAALCTIGSCNAGFGDCDATPVDGCEVNVATDPNNCGGCAVPCSNNHVAVPTCARSTCDGTCDNGFADCDRNLQTNGCEVNLTIDSANCGACGVFCNRGKVCVAGVCM